MLLMTPEGKKVQINTREDTCLYEAPQNPPNTGTKFTSGTDLYYHRARSGKGYYYTYFWSMWEGTEDSYELIDEDEAKEFILERATQSGYVSRGIKESACCDLWGEDFFSEDA